MGCMTQQTVAVLYELIKASQKKTNITHMGKLKIKLSLEGRFMEKKTKAQQTLKVCHHPPTHMNLSIGSFCFN